MMIEVTGTIPLHCNKLVHTNVPNLLQDILLRHGIIQLLLYYLFLQLLFLFTGM